MDKVMISQRNRICGLETELESDKLLVAGFSGTEGVSRLFSFTVELLSEDDSLDLTKLIGTKVTLRIATADGGSRVWNGYVSQVAQGWKGTVYAAYQLTIVPWLWFLTNHVDSRIFQGRTAVEIIREVFEKAGFADFTINVHGKLAAREMCVQYQERTFDFVSRLMEEEGIFYFFKHSNGRHELILANTPDAHKPCPGKSGFHHRSTAGGVELEDTIKSWSLSHQFVPSGVSLTDFNPLTPTVRLRVTEEGDNPFELHQHPGLFKDKTEGKRFAEIRQQELQAQGTIAKGEGGCRAFASGFRFQLLEHLRPDLNGDKGWYVLTEVRHRAHQPGKLPFLETPVDEIKDPIYHNEFFAIPYETPFRPQRKTPVPVIKGCQTAIVVGPSKEAEVETDDLGRVKVRFHWDRWSPDEGNSSCWIRVSQPWAGKDWGGLSIPRIDQEVIVEFLDGNPDRPIITGRVYNTHQRPPFSLPAGAANMGFKSKSIRGGGYNEISINDTDGNEGITMHAQYNMSTVVKHDQTNTVKNNRTEVIDVDESITVGHNRTEKVRGNEKVEIGKNQDLNVKGNRTEKTDGVLSVRVGKTKNEFVTMASAETVGLAKALSVGGAYAINVGAGMNTMVVGAQVEEVILTKKVIVGNSVEIVCGESSFKMDKSGKIKISGKEIEISGADGVKIVGKIVDIN